MRGHMLWELLPRQPTCARECLAIGLTLVTVRRLESRERLDRQFRVQEKDAAHTLSPQISAT
jgi:hypothetical protein